MQLIAPDIFAEVSQLSVGACLIGLILGVCIWTTGWWQHKFWVVVSVTAAAGMYGLQTGRAAGVQPLVAGLLAALAAGWMGLELARVLAFIGGGLTSSFLVQTFVPTAHEPLIAFLAGGLFGVVLFRLWMLVLTSMMGAIVATYCGLGLAGHWLKFDASKVVAEKAALLNMVVCGAAILGVLIQGRWDTWRVTAPTRKKTKAMKTLNDTERDAVKATTTTRGPLSRLLLPKKAG